MLSEEAIRNAVITWLSRKFEFRHVATTRGKPPSLRGRGRPRNVPPPDLIAKLRNQNYYYFVEAKGDPPSKFKLRHAIGEILEQTARKTPAVYAIACPISFKSIILRFPLSMWKRLSPFRILIVMRKSGTNVVKEIKPTAKGFAALRELH